MKTKELEAALPEWLQLDNVMLGKGGVMTRALAHSARDERDRCMSVIFDSKGRAYTRMFVQVEEASARSCRTTRAMVARWSM